LPVTLEDYEPALFRSLLAMEIAQRAPLAAVVESLRYENPIELILGGAAALLGGFAALPALVDRLQNWKSHKRNANALADQEESWVRQMRIDERVHSAQASQEEITAELMALLG
jgi:hypothetical protein